MDTDKECGCIDVLAVLCVHPCLSVVPFSGSSVAVFEFADRGADVVVIHRIDLVRATDPAQKGDAEFAAEVLAEFLEPAQEFVGMAKFGRIKREPEALQQR